MQYKGVPTRLDMGKLRVQVSEQLRADRSVRCKIDRRDRHQYTAPALAHAIYNVGLWFRELPITSEQIAMGIAEKECE